MVTNLLRASSRRMLIVSRNATNHFRMMNKINKTNTNKINHFIHHNHNNHNNHYNKNAFVQVPSTTFMNGNQSHGSTIKRFQSSSSELEADSQLIESYSLPTTPSLSPWEKVKKFTGLSTLIPEWKLMFSKENLGSDLMAGITVGSVAMPLSLAIALASGVSPETGLVSAIIGGSVACLLGGAPLGVTGPSLATTVLLSSVAATHGLGALVFVTAITGGLQVLSGLMRMGRLVQFVPQPVIAGFTAGVGGVMLIGQLPRVLGIVGPSSPGILHMGEHVLSQLSNIHPASIVLSLGTLATTMLLPKFFPKVPASVIAVGAAATLNFALGLGAPVIGAVSLSFPSFSIPSLPDLDTAYSLAGASMTLYGLTSLESLLSGSAADKIDKQDLRKHEPNVELIGQGLSNMAVSCFGGIPVTGAIARTSLNINSGAKTRRASLFHVCMLGGAFFMGPVVGMIPLSALSGILLSVAIRLLNPSELKFLSKVSFREVLPLVATFGTVLTSDLVTGVQVGFTTAAVLQFARFGENCKMPKVLDVVFVSGGDDEGLRCKLEGDVTFISASKITKLQEQLEHVPIHFNNPVIIDFIKVNKMDVTAGEMIIDMITYLEESGHTPESLRLVGLCRENKRVLSLCDSREIINKYIVKRKTK
jgi:carbonic anhydrase